MSDTHKSQNGTSLTPTDAQKPVAWGMELQGGLILDVICPDEHDSHEGAYTIPLYTAPPALTPTDAKKPIKSVLDKWESWAFSTSRDERNHDLCDSLVEIRKSDHATENALLEILQAVRAYLPPEGTSKDELINFVISRVDPWPTGNSPPTLAPPDGWAEAVGLAKIMAQLSKQLSERRAEILAQAILDMDAKMKEQG